MDLLLLYRLFGISIGAMLDLMNFDCAFHPRFRSWIRCQSLSWFPCLAGYIKLFYFHDSTGFTFLRKGFPEDIYYDLGPDAGQYLEKRSLLDTFKDLELHGFFLVIALLLHGLKGHQVVRLTAHWALLTLQWEIAENDWLFQMVWPYVKIIKDLSSAQGIDARKDSYARWLGFCSQWYFFSVACSASAGTKRTRPSSGGGQGAQTQGIIS